jgi:hypothetical protein
VGNTSVDLQPGLTLNYENPEDHGVFFPTGDGDVGDLGTGVSVLTYAIG